MVLYPAIDLKGGRCVRLEQGKPEREKVYFDDPATVARQWAAQGAQWLHVVDLDGALSSEPRNLPSLKTIRASVDIPIQFGGGNRTIDAVSAVLAIGANRVVLGTAALQSPDFLREACSKFGDRIAVGIDARDGRVAIRGWQDVTTMDAVMFAEQVERAGAGHIIYTDIARDGMLTGPNLQALKHMADHCSVSLIASGGIARLDDVAAVARLAPGKIVGMIIGKALYEGAFSLPEALITARKASLSSRQNTR
ncbi:MAG: 1-(5-phosphoribosyl)-5-[(5-phosphoribosylamino)methylideneamino]imidazole-4-carboxamide isomerase [Candidatus Abyssobacteria bacterium SURF_5]|jgi:phosphoribosylformimino-5-aminoimidazole carboxamide ribotide isomerase|uniref:1-(5-phosphoribosyl)-5-[(5-phosphoribosylamino)methylideneamino] imidazole-4-carboxamide isomerase n=1 Tax=Abyssobacteria bacterium (strain SURF_5) TaxID=2093360 RepID=A0A3A4NTX0_ABYX5|nr:MAG: 1-(5-phosphoribosyl)-5-[(5-phosphoribosylamino)methylideneamino]imidazole-4-carboxamide isomerase [Candidatus Abyssubacteria bacterium SURF_5]